MCGLITFVGTLLCIIRLYKKHCADGAAPRVWRIWGLTAVHGNRAGLTENIWMLKPV